jgi:hypothetical protein
VSTYGHASAVQTALAREQERQASMRTVAHVPAYNTRGLCTVCGLGKYWHRGQAS